MLINPTRGAMPLFLDMKKATNKKAAFAFAAQNPFFSWHAISAKVCGHYTIILVNDATYTPLVLAKIEEDHVADLEQLIRESIRELFLKSGIPSEKVTRYLELAGHFEVHIRHNKFVSAYMTKLNTLMTDRMPMDAGQFQLAFSLWMAEQPIRESGRVTPKQKLTAQFSKPLMVHLFSDL